MQREQKITIEEMRETGPTRSSSVAPAASGRVPVHVARIPESGC